MGLFRGNCRILNHCHVISDWAFTESGVSADALVERRRASSMASLPFSAIFSRCTTALDHRQVLEPCHEIALEREKTQLNSREPFLSNTGEVTFTITRGCTGHRRVLSKSSPFIVMGIREMKWHAAFMPIRIGSRASSSSGTHIPQWYRGTRWANRRSAHQRSRM
jgi:hypothetical protein